MSTADLAPITAEELDNLLVEMNVSPIKHAGPLEPIDRSAILSLFLFYLITGKHSF